MANEKITELTALTVAITTDVLAIVDDPLGTPISKKITLANLWSSLKALTAGEIFLTAAGGWPSTTAGCADAVKNEYVTNDIDLYTLDFDPDTDEFAQWSVWMPGDWNAGTITFKVLWSAASGSGDVVWGIQGRAFANDDAIDAAWGGAQVVTDTLTAVGDTCISPVSAAVTLAGTPAAGQFVQFRAYRDADAGGDTLAADAQLIGIKVYYGRS